MKAILSVLIITFGIASSASAISYTYTDTYTYKTDGTDGLYMSAWGTRTHSWEFDITGDDFNPNTQYVTNASIALTFWDDCDWFEIAKLNVGTNRFYWEVDSGDKSIGLSSLIDLSTTGKLTATLSAVLGDFWFYGGTLTATGADRGSGDVPAPVPEPATMLLFGVGLIGIAGTFRKVNKSQALQ